MAIGENWALENTGAFWLKDAKKILEQIKSRKKNKKFKLVKVCDRPLTFKEVEIGGEQDSKGSRRKNKR